jgi:peroxiredoxin
MLVLTAVISIAPGASAQLSMGSTAPDFSLRDLDNNVVSLSDFEDEVVLLFFFGFNCPFCIDEAPHLESKVWQKYMGDGFQVLGVDIWNGSTTELKTFFQGPTGVTFPVLMNGDAIGRDYKVSHDWYVLLDRQHKLVKTISGSYHNHQSAGTVVDGIAAEVSGLLAASVEDANHPEALPDGFSLRQNFPNPFNPETSILFSLGEDSRVELSVYNLRGERIRRLLLTDLGAGEHRVIWNGTDDSGQTAPSGIYFYRLAGVTAERRSISLSRRMVLTK